ncbi:secretin and TonB N-terminal domain-containing protein, partial [Paramuribaculum intestinale]
MTRSLRIGMILLLSMLFCVPPVSAAEPQKVTVELKNASLRQIFKQIENQTSYHFSYDSKAVDDRKDITLQEKSQPVDKVLDNVLEGRPLKYKIMSDNTIIITSRPAGDKASPGKTVKAKGVVTDTSGEPVPGATVRVKDSNLVAVT